MRTISLIAASILMLATACSALTGTPTPRPTYTPYPTYTPAAPIPTPVVLSQSDTTGAPLLLLGTTSALPTPTVSPEAFQEIGEQELFFGATLLEIEKAKKAFDERRYQDALKGYLEAQRLHSEPSVVLQSKIGTSYRTLGQSEDAIRHFTNALELKDNPTDRMNRSGRHMETGDCPSAIEDAKAALSMEPDVGEEIHTDAEANYILASCYAQQDEHLLALQHAEAALEVAKENSYTEIKLENMSLIRDSIQAVLDGQTWPEDLILEPAATHFYTGIAFTEEGKYEEAITKFKTAQEQHSRLSGTIQVWIGHAYSVLGQHETALIHFNNAIVIRDDPHHRVGRGFEYAKHGRCTEATTDAEAALGMKPYIEPGYHTSAEAHWILAACSPGEQTQAYMDQAANIARNHGYTEEEIAVISGIVDRRETSMVPDETIGKDPYRIGKCDGIFRNQLVFQRGASTADRMNVLVSQIQSQHSDCNSEAWNPVVIDLDNTTGNPAGKCFSDTAGTLPAAAATMPMIGSQVMPTSLGTVASATTYWARKTSGRDSENNILVYFSDTLSNRPSDGTSCWLYYARLKTWHHN